MGDTSFVFEKLLSYHYQCFCLWKALNFTNPEFTIESSREFGIRASRTNSASSCVNSCRDFLTKTPTFDASLILDRSAQVMFIIGSLLGFVNRLVSARTPNFRSSSARYLKNFPPFGPYVISQKWKEAWT